jgi:hypothetical protein
MISVEAFLIVLAVLVVAGAIRSLWAAPAVVRCAI